MRLLLALIAMLSGLSLPGTAYAVSQAEVVVASSAGPQAQVNVACPVRAAVARAAFRIERTTPLLLRMPRSGLAAVCGFIVKVDRARE